METNRNKIINFEAKDPETEIILDDGTVLGFKSVIQNVVFTGYSPDGLPLYRVQSQQVVKLKQVRDELRVER
ncbi:MAG: hypothetical protein AMDU1_APLC00053G0002 [Thermoplasmatales archaeon A-plasma]|nr:MAG: hypothetical protein AMDU1_APLC00053G0002 [Thermoplasmatales archaeon A-plasma]